MKNNNSLYGRQPPPDCPFENGIKYCDKAICLFNVFGGCFRQGSWYNAAECNKN